MKKGMKSHTAEIKRLNRDNNLIYIMRAEYLHTVCRVNEDRNYCSISDVLRDNRPKCIIDSHLSIRHQFNMFIQLIHINRALYSALLPKI